MGKLLRSPSPWSVALLALLVAFAAALAPHLWFFLPNPTTTRRGADLASRAPISRKHWLPASSPLEAFSAKMAENVAAAFRAANPWAQKKAAFNATGGAAPGVVVRLAAKAKGDARARGWTTHKPAVETLAVGPDGAAGDYNHYRTTAMQSTPDRALSIITSDVLRQLKEQERWPLADGDLGINVLVAGVPYAAFVVGRRYLLGRAVVQVTEPIQPCGYLCTLPFLRTKKRCEEFIKTLKGRRGWYARVLVAGEIHVGDEAVAL